MIIIAQVMSSYLCAQQIPTLYLANRDRDPKLYYWGNKWADAYSGQVVSTWVPSQNKCAVGRLIQIPEDTTLRVIGAAIGARIGFMTDPWYYCNSDTSNMLPEYLELWDATPSGLVKLAEAQWNNQPPSHYYVSEGTRMGQPRVVTTAIREAYFDNTFILKDSFYIVETNNNAYDCFDSTGRRIGRANPDVFYMDYQPQPSFPISDFPLIITQTRWNHPTVHNFDSLWHWETHSSFICLFPIIDTTNYTPSTGTTCDSVTGFHLMPPSEDGSVSLAWDQGSQTRWDISYGVSGTQPDAGQILTTPAPFFHLYGLDSTQWYVAYVRNVCDDGTSPWSDSLRFRVTTAPPQDTTVGILTSAADRYTKLWPNPTSGLTTLLSSFRIRDYALYTLDGILLERNKVDAISATIDMSRHPQGTYIIAINTIRGTVTRKLVIK